MGPSQFEIGLQQAGGISSVFARRRQMARAVSPYYTLPHFLIIADRRSESVAQSCLCGMPLSLS